MGFWPVPFFSDEALQIAGVFHQGQFPSSSGYGTSRESCQSADFNWKNFFRQKLFINEESDPFP